MSNTNNETKFFRIPKQLVSVDLRFTKEQMEWLCGTILDNDGNAVANSLLFYDLLSRMRTEPGADNAFRRPMPLPQGWLQFSEPQLATEWNMGRKKVHNLLLRLEALGAVDIVLDTTHSAMKMKCVFGWTVPVVNTPSQDTS